MSKTYYGGHIFYRLKSKPKKPFQKEAGGDLDTIISSLNEIYGDDLKVIYDEKMKIIWQEE